MLYTHLLCVQRLESELAEKVMYEEMAEQKRQEVVKRERAEAEKKQR